MRKICSSSSLCALTSPSWQLGAGGDHQLGIAGSSYGLQSVVLHAATANYAVQPKHKVPAADESVLWMLQRHLQLMPLSYAEAGFSVEEMLHHIRIFKEMQNGRKLGLLVTSSRSSKQLPSYYDASSKLPLRSCKKINVDNVHVKSYNIQPSGKSIEIHFADHCVHSHSTALEALGLQQLVAGDHVKLKKVQIFQRSREGLGVLAIARIKLPTCTAAGNLQDSIKAAKGSWIKALENCCSFHGLNSGPTPRPEVAFCSVSSSERLIRPKIAAIESPSASLGAESCLSNVGGWDAVRVAEAAVGCINRDHDWTTGYAGGGFVNELLKKWWVNGDELSLSRQLGVGSSGAVYQGTYRGNTKVAVKLVNNSHDSHFRRELLALGSLSMSSASKHILPLVGACRDSLLERCVVVTRFMEGGSLHAYLQREPRLDNRRVLQLATHIAKGMLFLHSRGIIHMDLKSPNIFLDTDGSAVIGDLGCARAVNEKEATSKVDTGTYRWMAPEAFGEEGGTVAATRMMDVYSFGMVLWELVSSEVPWAGKSPVQAAAAVVLQPGLRPPIPAHCFPPFACLIRKCWAHNPTHRPSFDQILRMLHLISPPPS
eukprot:c14401_g1_i1 orf=327-2123(-)